MRKTLALILAVLMVFGLSGVVSAEEEAYNPDAIIYETSTDDPTHLDPALATDGQSTVVTQLLYSALVGYNKDGSLYIGRGRILRCVRGWPDLHLPHSRRREVP